jgi:hypothetical protein
MARLFGRFLKQNAPVENFECGEGEGWPEKSQFINFKAKPPPSIPPNYAIAKLQDFWFY